jgi:hypothetical protein
MKVRVAFLGLALAFGSIAWGQSQKATPKSSATTKDAPDYQKWADYWQNSLGITEEEFNEAGLGQLTKTQGTKLWLAVYQHRPNMSCGVTFADKEVNEYHFVHIHVTGTDSDAEFVGRLRGKLSAIRDVKLVSTDEDADLGVSVLTVSNEVGSARVGITVATTIYQPCEYTVKGGFGDGIQKIKVMLDNFINAAAKSEDAATSIADTLDARDFEDTRRNHAQLLKYLQK